jgi:uncharacterized membrane protein YgdD (TMEM256/DUF423 family)
MNRGLIVAAGLAGAIGVALAAAGAHIPGGERLATAGTMAMAQAPALLALGFFIPGRGILFATASWAIAIGLLAFAGALAFHDLSGNAALAFLAPIGGTAMILGWIGLAVAGIIARR